MDIKIFFIVLALTAANNFTFAQQSEDFCSSHLAEICGEPGDFWNPGPCNAIYGGFKANSNNLHQLMIEQFQDSFKMLIYSSYFSTDIVNRNGFHKTIMDHSDDMWNNGKDIMKYIMQRGGRMGDQFKVKNFELPNEIGEVEILGKTLDILKTQTSNAIIAHKHAMSRKIHSENVQLDSYDPSIADFLEDSLIESGSSKIRETAGALNVLAKIARNDNTKNMGLHLFDMHLSH